MYAPPAERQGKPFSAGQGALPALGLASHDLVPDSEQRGMLASPAFWVGGMVSVAVWTALALAILRWI